MHTCLAYPPVYPCPAPRQTARTHHRCSEQGWVLDVTTIFAELDAFTQRCKDLIEICNCQMYLNRCVRPMVAGGGENMASGVESETYGNEVLSVIAASGI